MALRKLFHDSVIELPSQPGMSGGGLNLQAVRGTQAEELMTVGFSLSPDNDKYEELEARVASGEVFRIACNRQAIRKVAACLDDDRATRPYLKTLRKLADASPSIGTREQRDALLEDR